MTTPLITQIINQLREILPKYTTKFSNTIAISSLTSSGTLATANSVDHGLITGNYISIKGAKVPYAISNLTRIGTQATALTTQQNQVIYSVGESVEIVGANESDYNGVHTLIEPKKIKISSLVKAGDVITATTEEAHGFIVNANFKINIWGAEQQSYNQTEISILSTPTTTSFTYTLKGEIISPATTKQQIYCQAIHNEYTFFYYVVNNPTTPATGTIYQLRTLNKGYNGLKQITRIDDDIFTYTLEEALNSPAQGTITGDYKSRIDGAISIERAIEGYTAQSTDNYWLFIVQNPTKISKDRKEKSDANYTHNNSEFYEQIVIYNFTIYVFIPAVSSVGGAEMYASAQDLLYPFSKTLNGVGFDRFFDYSKAYYIHGFEYETTGYIQRPDIVEPSDRSAFRRIEESYLNQDNEDTGIKNDIVL